MEPLTHAIAVGWEPLVIALLHTLWIGGMAAGGVAWALGSIPAANAARRQGACLAGLALILLGGMTAWAIAGQRSTQSAAPPAATPAIAQTTASDAAPEPSSPAVHAVHPVHPVHSTAATPPAPAGAPWAARVAAFWLAGVALMLVRMTLALTGAGRLRRRCRVLPAAAPLQAILDELAAVLGGARRIPLLVGETLAGPAVVGALRPAILWPAAWLTGLPEWQVRAILAHELAHIVRRDYLVNIFQMLVEALLFFNPAVWWLGRQLRVEREAACDALAARLLGERADLARALAEAETLRPGAGAPEAALAFGGPAPRGRLLDRVRRLLEPGHRPAVRLPWPSLAVMLIAATGLLASLQTASLAVAQAILTPEQRIEKARAIQETFQQHAMVDREYGEADMVRLRFTVRTWDGKPLPERWTNASVSWDRPRNSGMEGNTLRGSNAGQMSPDGTRFAFDSRVQYGAIRICVRAPGYAPVFAGPFYPEPGGNVDAGTLVLGQGFPAAVAVTDPDGRPLEGVELSAYSSGKMNGWGPKGRTNAEGIAIFDHACTVPLTFTAVLPGYETRTYPGITLGPDRPIRLGLTPAVPATGAVLDSATSNPLVGAEIKFLMEYSPGSGGDMRDATNAPVWATTNEQGRFSLDRLQRGKLYDFLVQAPNHRWVIARRIEAGQQGIVITLGPPLVVRGRVINLNELPTPRNGRYRMAYLQPYRNSEAHSSSLTGTRWIDLDAKDGEAPFEISDLWQGELHLNIGGGKVIEVDHSLDGVIVDAAPRPKDRPEVTTRTVVLHLVPPAGGPSPRGFVEVSSIETSMGSGGSYRAMRRPEQMPIAPDGTITLAVETPNEIEMKPNGLVGYWLPSKWSGGEEVPAGEGPFDITVPLQPAGAVYGRIMDQDGSPVSNAGITVGTVTRPKAAEEAQERLELSVDSDQIGTDGRFNAGPIPMGWTVRLITNRGYVYAVSPEIVLDPADPFHELTLTMPATRPLSGRVIDADGNPVAGAEVKLGFYAPGMGFGRSPSPMTDADGRFFFDAIDRDIPADCNYTVEINPAKGHPVKRVEVTTDPAPMMVQLDCAALVAGRVVDAKTGKPLEGMEVYALPAWPEYWKDGVTYTDADAPTDSDGRFRFTRLIAGRPYSLNVRGGNAVDARNEVTAGEASENVELPVKPSDGWLARHRPNETN